VVVVSSGDPGVFAMAAAVLEALHESTDPAWHRSSWKSCRACPPRWPPPRRGAPLGHDFCVMSLSDNLKPWSIIEKRLDLAAQADLALAFYNPISRARPWQLGRAWKSSRNIARGDAGGAGRDIGRPGQTCGSPHWGN
jgi:cobalt-precorrin 5A hydrolase/precorrin-3B C17-methyltransferase